MEMKMTIQLSDQNLAHSANRFAMKFPAWKMNVASFCGRITEILEVERCLTILRFGVDREARIEDSRNFANLEFESMRAESSRGSFLKSS
jgi:hypothetical protein